MNVLKFHQGSKKLTVIAVLAIFFAFTRFGDNQVSSWQQMKSLGVSSRRFVAAGFSIGNKGYVGIGLIGDEQRKDFWEYDPVANTWAQKADFGGGKRNAAVSFSIGSKGYVGTGIDGDSMEEKNDFWEFDPIKNTWTKKADFPGAPRVVATGFSIGSKGYIGNGRTENFLVYFNDFWEYDPVRNIWIQKSDFGGAARYATTNFVIGNKAYVGMGTEREVSEFHFDKDFWQYDPQTNAWTRKSDFAGNARELATAFTIGTKAYLGTGFNGNDLKDFWQYDPLKDSWLRLDDFAGGERYAGISFSINNYGYVGMGMSDVREKSDLWKFTPNNLINRAETSRVSPSKSKKVIINY
jgi:N-acetylneuraminic acid mutarotase